MGKPKTVLKYVLAQAFFLFLQQRENFIFFLFIFRSKALTLFALVLITLVCVFLRRLFFFCLFFLFLFQFKLKGLVTLKIVGTFCFFFFVVVHLSNVKRHSTTRTFY